MNHRGTEPQRIQSNRRTVLPSDHPRSRAFGGLLVRRYVWLPSWRALVLLGVIALATIYSGTRWIHPFLEVTETVEADVLVVEGWVPDYTLEEGWNQFVARGDKLLLTTGTMVKSGVDVDPDDTYALMAARRLLRRFATPGADIRPVPSSSTARDRTYGSAVALAEWLKQNRPEVRGINVVTLGIHARRSRMMFQRALGDEFQVGVIAVRDRDYEPEHWWRYSEGVKEVLSETAAYFYACSWLSP
jgi:hypothetical protein